MSRPLIGLALLAAGAVGPAAAIAVAPAAGGAAPLLVVVAPWSDAEEIVTAAGGRIVGLATAPLAVLAAGSDGFPERVLAAGAWLVRDGSSLSWMCEVLDV